jgi:hypothetical protein
MAFTVAAPSRVIEIWKLALVQKKWLFISGQKRCGSSCIGSEIQICVNIRESKFLLIFCAYHRLNFWAAFLQAVGMVLHLITSCIHVQTKQTLQRSSIEGGSISRLAIPQPLLESITYLDAMKTSRKISRIDTLQVWEVSLSIISPWQRVSKMPVEARLVAREDLIGFRSHE